jgi:hypothetical protein
MEASRHCRLFALQCFEWAAKIDDPSQHLIFTVIARDWLSAAREAERSPESAQQALRARLH